MIIYDREKIIEWLTEVSLRPCDFSRPEDYDDNMTEDLAMGAIELLKSPEPRRGRWYRNQLLDKTTATFNCGCCFKCWEGPRNADLYKMGFHFCPNCGAAMEPEKE